MNPLVRTIFFGGDIRNDLNELFFECDNSRPFRNLALFSDIVGLSKTFVLLPRLSFA